MNGNGDFLEKKPKTNEVKVRKFYEKGWIIKEGVVNLKYPQGLSILCPVIKRIFILFSSKLKKNLLTQNRCTIVLKNIPFK